MLHLGLLITKDDDEIIGPWFRENCGYFDEVVCLDGSQTEVTRQAAEAEENVVYMHERECVQLLRTDHGLREAVHQEIIKRHGHQGWVTLCHADEFFYHSPRKCCELAESRGTDGISWYATHFLPHPKDLPHREHLRCLPAHLRFRYYHWDLNGTGVPWLEFRSFRNTEAVTWSAASHGSPQPLGCRSVAEFHPAYLHFKVFSLDPAWYASEKGWTRFAHHWQDVTVGQTGLNWTAHSIEELFVDHYETYRQCSRFDGKFDHAWNLGEEYR